MTVLFVLLCSEARLIQNDCFRNVKAKVVLDALYFKIKLDYNINQSKECDLLPDDEVKFLLKIKSEVTHRLENVSMTYSGTTLFKSLSVTLMCDYFFCNELQDFIESPVASMDIISSRNFYTRNQSVLVEKLQSQNNGLLQFCFNQLLALQNSSIINSVLVSYTLHEKCRHYVNENSILYATLKVYYTQLKYSTFEARVVVTPTDEIKYMRLRCDNIEESGLNQSDYFQSELIIENGLNQQILKSYITLNYKHEGTQVKYGSLILFVAIGLITLLVILSCVFGTALLRKKIVHNKQAKKQQLNVNEGQQVHLEDIPFFAIDLTPQQDTKMDVDTVN